ncbi:MULTISPECIES: VWA domain-containing protein [Catenuloplanes]|uniref:Ca-activated chloride channel family protein n=1 Tax=Catenuloplanes niger TaxID=587534 RepID=A0AAE3ZYD2_9ACTN|nr:VWA domain-containing protein [Catenuloplanes niger]MDR7327197.1 Ca-activated chloride channel family protein [Catenuloplanes niger]
MTWQSPERLWLLAAVLLLAAGYLVVQRRRGRYAVRFTNLALLDTVAPKRPGWRRHVPASLFLAMCALLVVGFARPSDEVRVPRERATVLIAVDVSASMAATDVAPDRLASAKAAAREFAAGLPEQYNAGLVAFAGTAAVLVPPGTDRARLTAGIDRIGMESTGRPGTAIGEAVAASLAAVQSLGTGGTGGDDTDGQVPARLVVLSDGQNTAGRAPSEAAAEAARLGIPVDTIAVGTTSGDIQLEGRSTAVPVDGQTLRAVSEQTGGRHFEAGSADELRAVYADIGSLVGFELERQDVSWRFIGAGLVLALLAAGLSMLWFSRLP